MFAMFEPGAASASEADSLIPHDPIPHSRRDPWSGTACIASRGPQGSGAICPAAVGLLSHQEPAWPEKTDDSLNCPLPVILSTGPKQKPTASRAGHRITGSGSGVCSTYPRQDGRRGTQGDLPQTPTPRPAGAINTSDSGGTSPFPSSGEFSSYFPLFIVLFPFTHLIYIHRRAFETPREYNKEDGNLAQTEYQKKPLTFVTVVSEAGPQTSSLSMACGLWERQTLGPTSVLATQDLGVTLSPPGDSEALCLRTTASEYFLSCTWACT